MPHDDQYYKRIPHYCTTCDDNAGGCMPEAQINETCEEDAEACTVELFFTPENHNAFVFRSRCGPPSHCPARYTELMCTPFMDKMQTCRICCFENNCHDATPASPLRLKIMKRLLIDVGKNPAQVEHDIHRANMYARSLSTATRVPTTPEPFSTAGGRRTMLRTRRPASVEAPVISTPRPRAISETENPELLRIREMGDIVTLPADKGRSTVVMDKTDYTTKLQSLLEDEGAFELSETGEFKKHVNSVNRAIDKLRKAGALKRNETLAAKAIDAAMARFYGLPEVHKPGVPLRP
ncbi:hypothetical protein SprV_0702354400 [Sparganum proliferum]